MRHHYASVIPADIATAYPILTGSDLVWQRLTVQQVPSQPIPNQPLPRPILYMFICLSHACPSRSHGFPNLS
jgi:hypothetical protein